MNQKLIYYFNEIKKRHSYDIYTDKTLSNLDMRATFDFYYNFYNEEKLKTIWKKESTFFIFDTNVLLDLYRYAPTTQTKWFEILQEIKNRAWLPHHVGVEFYKNRLSVINNKKKEIEYINKIFTELPQKLTKITDKYKKNDYKDIHTEIGKLKGKINDLLQTSKLNIVKTLTPSDDFKTDWNPEKDKTLQKIKEIFNTKNIGENLFDTQEKIDNLFKTAKLRWENGLPPGKKDFENKKDNSFIFQDLIYYEALGDLIIFKEIKNFALNNKHIENIIFVTNDSKEDWKQSIDDKAMQNLKLGCRPELRYELLNHAKNIRFFEITTLLDFLEISTEMKGQELSIKIKEDIQKKSSAREALKEIILTQIENEIKFKNWREVLEDNEKSSRELLEFLEKSISFYTKRIKNTEKHLERRQISLKNTEDNSEYNEKLQSLHMAKMRLKHYKKELKEIELYKNILLDEYSH